MPPPRSASPAILSELRAALRGCTPRSSPALGAVRPASTRRSPRSSRAARPCSAARAGSWPRGRRMENVRYTSKRLAEIVGATPEAGRGRAREDGTGSARDDLAVLRETAAPPARAVPAAQAALPQLQGRHRQDVALHLLRLPAGRARLPRAADRPRQPGPRHQVPRLRGRELREDAARRAGAQDARSPRSPSRPACRTSARPVQPGHEHRRPRAHAHGRPRVQAEERAAGGRGHYDFIVSTRRRPSGCST